MRLIGTVKNEKQAFTVYALLLQEGIHGSYEKEGDQVAIWIYEEDGLERAQELLAAYKADPDSPIFAKVAVPAAPPLPPDLIAEKKSEEARKNTERLGRSPSRRASVKRKRKSYSYYPLTYGIILLCIFLYFLNTSQQYGVFKADGKLGVQIGMTPLQQELMFEYPKPNQEIDALIEKYNLSSFNELKTLPESERVQFEKANAIPTWKGILSKLIYYFKQEPDPNENASLFTQIKEGQVWRLFTPCLLHGNFLHILFNMAWAWLLLKQMEERLSKFKIIFLIVIIAVVANVAQYLVSGPLFLGFSGVVMGLVGFIWVRQKVAPWEGYPLHRSTIIFILVFIGAMFALELFSIVTALITAKEISANIANTAHIIGGLTGALLARVPFFARGMR